MANILAVDDSEIIRNIITQLLAPTGHKVTVAEDGSKGLEAFKGGEYDIVITDINMPVMDGITLITELRKINDEVPILVLSTESDKAMVESGDIAGANGWVVKPLNPAQFLDLIRQILEM